MANPLVTVITPTWERYDVVFRAIMSVALQTYRPIQHIVVSDGPNPDLRRALGKVRGLYPGYELVYAELPAHPPARWGHFARLHGIVLADGDLIAYLDDDDEFRPSHIEGLAGLMTAAPSIDFAYSQILIHEPHGDIVSGAEPPAYAQISTSSIMHRRKLLEAATWRDEGQETIDWDLALRWLQHGARWAFLPRITSVAHRDGPNSSSSRPRSL